MIISANLMGHNYATPCMISLTSPSLNKTTIAESCFKHKQTITNVGDLVQRTTYETLMMGSKSDILRYVLCMIVRTIKE